MNLELPSLQHPPTTDLAQRGRIIIGDVARALPFSGLGMAAKIDGITGPPTRGTSINPLDNLAGGVAGLPGGGLLGPGSALGDLLAQLMALLSQLFGNGTGSGSGSNENLFTNATGSSNGDPHLNFNGTQNDGTGVNSRWDSMTAHADLLDSDSFDGGYQLATQTTAPNAQGISYNQSATVTSHWGGTAVSLDNAGNATVIQDGSSTPLAIGQSVNLGNGESATRNSDGSLNVTMTNANGASIVTTMRQNGQGVDVSATANNVDLGGDLVVGAPPVPPIQPVLGPPGMRDPIRLAPL